MATELGVAYLSVVASTGGLGKDIERQMGGVGASSGKKLGGGIMGGFKAAIGPLAAIMGAQMGIQAVGNFLRSANDEARESQKVNRVTAQIIKATGKAAGMTAGQIGELATAISNKTGVDDEAVQQSANLLLTFKKVRNEVGAGNQIFDRATAAAQDLAAAGFGDANSAAKMLGKALNDPEKGMTALSRAGVTFTQEQKDQVKAMLKAGDTLGAQKLIMKEVESQVGGVAAATATATQKMGVKWSNFKEAIGTAFIIPAVDAISTKLSPVIDWMSASIPKVQTFFKSFSGAGAGVVAGIVAAFSPLAMMLKVILPILPQIGTTFATLGGQLASTLLPVLTQIAPVVQQVAAALAGGLQGVILALLPAITQIASAALPVLAQVMATLVPVVLQVAQAFLPIVGVVMQLVSALLPPLSAIIISLMPVFSALGSAVAEVVQAFLPMMPIVTELASYLGGVLVEQVKSAAVGIAFMVPALVGLIKWFGSTLATAVKFANGAASVISGFAKAVSAKISEVGAWFGRLKDLILKGDLAGAASWLTSAGANLLRGLWQGVQDTQGWLLNQLGGMSDRLIKFVLDKFGVHSPSRVFRWIGTQLTAGLAKGITASTSDAVSAIDKMISLVNSTASKAVGKAAKKQAKAAAKAVEAILKAQQNAEKSGTLANIAAQREALADKIKAANDELAAQVSARDQMKSQIAGGIVGEFDVAAAAKRGGASGIASSISSLVAKAKAFAGKLKALIAAGYPPGLVQEIAGLGTAGIRAADALLSATDAQRGSIISDYGSLLSWSDQAGLFVADQMYGVGIAAQQAMVDGLLAEDSALANAAKSLVEKLTNQIRKRLGLSVTTGKSVAGNVRSVQAGELRQQSTQDQPVVMNGQIVAWIKKTATGAAHLVLADESLNAQLAMA